MVDLPRKGVIVPLDVIKIICFESYLVDLWGLIEKDPPKRPFKSVGCSMWPDNWAGNDLYPACFMHHLKYWCGDPEDNAGRLKADLELGLDVLEATCDAQLAMMMLQGVRIGGNEMFKQRFLWGFGRI